MLSIQRHTTMEVNEQIMYHEVGWAKGFYGGAVNFYLFFFLSRRGEKAALTGKTPLPKDKSIGFGGAQIFLTASGSSRIYRNFWGFWGSPPRKG